MGNGLLYCLLGGFLLIIVLTIWGALKKEGIQRRLHFKLGLDSILSLIALFVSYGLVIALMVAEAAIFIFMENNESFHQDVLSKYPWIQGYVGLSITTAGIYLVFWIVSRRYWLSYSDEEKQLINEKRREMIDKRNAWLIAHNMSLVASLFKYKEFK